MLSELLVYSFADSFPGEAEPVLPEQVTALFPEQLKCQLCPTACHDNVTMWP